MKSNNIENINYLKLYNLITLIFNQINLIKHNNIQNN